MSEQKTSFGQSDIIRLSDEDATTALIDREVTGYEESLNVLDASPSHDAAKFCVTIFVPHDLNPASPLVVSRFRIRRSS